ncbi:MAG: hypothetical protein PF689_10845 [Deltaproteobacteria bacterium]|jgi:hypothetical protein|nr:hypothetical protein [Deltaproteobacteria bacterium]
MDKKQIDLFNQEEKKASEDEVKEFQEQAENKVKDEFEDLLEKRINPLLELADILNSEVDFMVDDFNDLALSFKKQLDNKKISYTRKKPNGKKTTKQIKPEHPEIKHLLLLEYMRRLTLEKVDKSFDRIIKIYHNNNNL